MAKRTTTQLPADRLNEQARLYPWRLFNQSELVEMTSVPRVAVSAAFNAAEFPAQCGLSRPEDVFKWVRAQDVKVLAKQCKDANAETRREARKKTRKEKSRAAKRSQVQPDAAKRSEMQSGESGET